MDCKAKKCKRPLPIRVFQWSNKVALENDFCSVLCMFTELGVESAWVLLNAHGKGVGNVKQSTC